jgi:hypothetical protein
LALKRLGRLLHQRRVEKERRELADRTYQELDAAKDFPVAKNLYYECGLCGNVVPSMPGKQVSCKCGNVDVDASGHPTVHNHEKVKLFSAPG